jgi:hypothetical protein
MWLKPAPIGSDPTKPAERQGGVDGQRGLERVSAEQFVTAVTRLRSLAVEARDALARGETDQAALILDTVCELLGVDEETQ